MNLVSSTLFTIVILKVIFPISMIILEENATHYVKT